MSRFIIPSSLIVVVLFSFLSKNCFSQQQWRFHVAYEEATGSKDTLWFIWDTTATFYGADTLLGETSAIFNYDEFNVWTYNSGLTWNDSIKIVAHPYEYSFGHDIYAMNFELPVTISWDTSLLHAPFLPPLPVGWINHARIDNDYFFMVNNCPTAHQFDMTLINHVMAPDSSLTNPWYWNPAIHFPASFFLMQDPTLYVNNFNVINKKPFSIKPNPVAGILIIESKMDKFSAQIISCTGQTVFHNSYHGNGATIDVSSFPSGLYILHFITEKNKCYYEKFIKKN